MITETLTFEKLSYSRFCALHLHYSIVVEAITLKKASAVVSDTGGRTCSVAIISRELGIPAVTGTIQGTALLKTGERVIVDGSEGAIYAVIS